MDPRPHTPVLPQKIICIKLSGPPSLQATNTFRLELHNIFLLFLRKGKATCGNKFGAVVERNFKIRGLKNKNVL